MRFCTTLTQPGKRSVKWRTVKRFCSRGLVGRISSSGPVCARRYRRPTPGSRHAGLIISNCLQGCLNGEARKIPNRRQRFNGAERDYQQIEKEAIKGGQELLQGLQGILTETKIDVTARLVQFEEPLDPKHITIDILKIVVERDYGTVVVGGTPFPA